MAIENIYIARHGYRSNWLPKGPYPPPPTGIDNDVPLSEHGVEQAHELANYISKLDVKPEMIFCSPFYRCLETSRPTVESLKIPLYIDRGVGEWYKPDRPIIPEPATHEVMSKFFPAMINPNWESSIIPSNKGETEEDIFERCHKFWPIFIEKVERRFPEIKTIMIVTHAATKSALGMNLLKFSSAKEPIDDKGTFIRNGSCAIDKFEVVKAEGENLPFEKRVWTITMNGNTSFLTNGEEMNWTFMNAFEAGSDADIKARRAAESSKLKTE